MADVLEILSTVSFVLAALLFMLCIVLWVKFKIPAVYATMHHKAGGKTTSENTQERATLTHRTGYQFYYNASSTTSKPQVNVSQVGDAGNEGSEQTELLSEETELLDGEATMPLDPSATMLLDQEDVEATVLLSSQNIDKRLEMLDDIVMLHTREIIILDSN